MATTRRMILSLLPWLFAISFANSEPLSERFEQRYLVIPTDDGQKELTVSVAATLDEKIMGLQGIASMPLDHGLLMVLDKSQPGTIWMKDTLVHHKR